MKNLLCKNLLVLLFLLALTTMSFKAEIFLPAAKQSCPTANFCVANNGCVAPCEMVFTNCSQNADSYLWNFGDGTTSTEENPRHAYSSTGNFTVTLTAYADGCQAAEHIIIVETVDI